MKKICFVTAARSEYGLLKWLMKDVQGSALFELQVVVTGAHLMKGQGHTIDLIRSDGFVITGEVDIQPDTASPEGIAASMGKMAESFSHVFSKLRPDYIVVLGDRYELLPIVSTAFVMRIPVIHLSGGDVTEGAIDDGIRNAVTMLADYHFPGTQESAENIIRMRGTDKNVWAVGEPGLDSFYRESLMNRAELSESLGLDINSKWVLFTFHPETKQSLKYNLDAVKTCISLLRQIEGLQIVATYANADFGGTQINECLKEASAIVPDKIKAVPSLGSRRYLSFMNQVAFVIGNSSSGIVEAPALGVPVVNIGERQKGRHLCSNVIQAENHEESIRSAIDKALTRGGTQKDFYWGDGHTAEKVLKIMERELLA